MSGNVTTVSIGSTSVSTSGALTGKLLEQFASALSVSAAVTLPATATSLPASDGLHDQTLIIPSGYSGPLSVPAGYEFVIYQGAGTLQGGDSNTVVIGDLNYAGGAGTIVGTGSGSGTVVATDPGAVVALATGNEMVFGNAASQSYNFDSGFDTLLASGAGDTLVMGGAASLFAFFNDGGSFTQTGGASTIVAGGAAATMNASAGQTEFWTSANNAVSLGSGSAIVLGNASGTTSVTAGTGSDTVVAVNTMKYMGGTGNSLFVGGSGMSTVYTATNETAYGGTGGDVMSIASGSKLLFVGDGGADSVMGGTIAPTIWGNKNENLTVSDSVAGGNYVLFGNNDQMNLMNSGGGSHIIAVDGAPFAGNASLTMSSAGNDSLVLFSPDQFGLTHANATITVMNWQASDILDLTFANISGHDFGYSATDQQSAQTQLGSGNSFTLSDGTTVVFQGAKPTTVYHV